MKSNNGRPGPNPDPAMSGESFQALTNQVIREWKDRADLTNEDCAVIAGVSKQTWANRVDQKGKFKEFKASELRKLWQWSLENGVEPPDIDLLIKGASETQLYQVFEFLSAAFPEINWAEDFRTWQAERLAQSSPE